MRRTLILLACLAWASVASAQDTYPLQITWPTAIGAAGTGHDADSYIYRAWTGIPWSMRVVATGGTWSEYTLTLTNAPAGMTVNETGPCIEQPCDNWTLTWDNPTSTASNITVEMCDADECDDQTWSITVAACAPGAGGCCVLNADTGNDSTGAGTVASPWQTLDKARDSCGARSVLYLRGGTSNDYTMAGLPATEDDCVNPLHIPFNEASQPVIWVRYPGDLSPVIDLALGLASPVCILFIGENIWVDGLTFKNGMHTSIQVQRGPRFGSMIKDTTFQGCGPEYAGLSNEACVMYQTVTNGSYWDALINSTFEDIEYDEGVIAVKMYGTIRWAFDDNIVQDVHDYGGGHEGLIAIKGGEGEAFAVRNNRCIDFAADVIAGQVPCIGGNMAGSLEMDGEMLHNLLNPGGGDVLYIGESKVSTIGPILVQRNTLIGKIRIQNVTSSDGPYTFENNVIVNADGAQSPWPFVEEASVSDPSRVVINISSNPQLSPTGVQNLAGASGDAIVDASGDLQNSYVSFIGSQGYQFGDSPAPSTGPARIRITPPDFGADGWVLQ